MDTDEDENVCSLHIAKPFRVIYSSQGLEGTIQFSGNTPDLGEFTIRVVDGA